MIFTTCVVRAEIRAVMCIVVKPSINNENESFGSSLLIEFWKLETNDQIHFRTYFKAMWETLKRLCVKELLRFVKNWFNKMTYWIILKPARSRFKLKQWLSKWPPAP